jgi:bifunctional non-homologous end joining protein LigD
MEPLVTEDLLAGLPPEAREQVRPCPQPDWIPPMLATLTQRRFSSPDWIFERKLDGERCLGFVSAAGVRLLSRNRHRLDGTYPEIADALASATEHEVVVDGEVVAFEGGQTSFARLQRRIGISDPALSRRSGVAVTYFLFDVLHLDGHDVTGVPLRHRKSLLRRALTFRSPLRFTAHRNCDGERFLEEACRRGWEGLVAKRADAPYVGGRSRDWLKLKCSNRQEMVVGGFTDPRGTRVGFGALLLGHHDGDRLVYAGKVGTGYDTATLRELRSRLDALEQPQSPFAGGTGRQAGVHWVRPELVAEVEFTEWTRDGKLRHPSYKGLRYDKAATDVVREERG